MRGEGDLFIKWSSLGAFRFPLWACSVRCGREVRCSRGSAIAHSPSGPSLLQQPKQAQARRSALGQALGCSVVPRAFVCPGITARGTGRNAGHGQRPGNSSQAEEDEGPGASLPGIEQQRCLVSWGRLDVAQRGNIGGCARLCQGHNPLDDPGTLGHSLLCPFVSCRLMRLHAALAGGGRGRMRSFACLLNG